MYRQTSERKSTQTPKKLMEKCLEDESNSLQRHKQRSSRRGQYQQHVTHKPEEISVRINIEKITLISYDNANNILIENILNTDKRREDNINIF